MIRRGGQRAEEIIAAAFARATTPEQVVATTLRLAPIQFFYIQASALARDAFVNSGHISSRCCVGYSQLILNGLLGILSVTISNAFILTIPLGVPTDTPTSGTVWGNVRLALSEIVATIAAAKEIARCSC